jgi:Holliday junction resolvasome RuvABC ATP-dependent DNA helicase subunit
MIRQMLSNLLSEVLPTRFRTAVNSKVEIFDSIIGYDGIKRTFIRSLNSKEPVHILLVGPPGQAKTLFLKCILEEYGSTKAYFTVGGNASKSGMIDMLFAMQPSYLLIDEIEHLKSEYQTILLSLMETGIVTQTIHKKVRQRQLKTWVFATSNGTMKLSEPLLSRFRVLYLNQHDFQLFYEISIKRLLAEGISQTTADEITKFVWKQQLPNPNIRNCIQIARLVKNEPNIEQAIAEEIENFKDYGQHNLSGCQKIRTLCRSRRMQFETCSLHMTNGSRI